MKKDVVLLTVPAKPDYILAVRLLVSAVAERAEFSFNDIEDIKVASAEACTLLLAENPKELNVQITVEESLCVCIQAQEPAGSEKEADEVTELSQHLLEALVDKCELDKQNGILNKIIIYKY